ncbi:MAG: CBS domain-containing protein, partial [Burkholderiales bacterium]
LDTATLVGLIDESDLLINVHDNPARFRDPVTSAMTSAPETIAPDASLPELEALLDRGLIAIVAEGGHFYGLITRYDLLNHLRRALA